MYLRTANMLSGTRYVPTGISFKPSGSITAVTDSLSPIDGMGVLVCSGYVREDLLRRGIHAGRYAFLAKPFTADQLIASVDGVLRAVAALRTDR